MLNKILLVLGGLLFSSSLFAVDFEDVTPEEAGFSSDKLAEIQVRFDALYESGRIPNYAIGIFSGHKRFYAKARGNTEIDGGKLVGLDTIYPLASMTKPIVSTAIMRLIQEKKLSLDSRLSEFYPEFKNMFVAPNGSFEANFQEAKREITVRDLLTHTSGFTYHTFVTGQGDVAKQYDDLGVFWLASEETMSEHISTLSQIPLLAHPGETFTYSISVDVLGAVIEKVTGMRMGEYLKKTIFDPLGMNNSGFFVPSDKTENFAGYYKPLPVATLGATPSITSENTDSDDIQWQIIKGSVFGNNVATTPPPFDSGGAGLYSTINDYARYCAMIQNGGSLGDKEILNQETLELHLSDLTPQLTSEDFGRDFGEGAAFMKFGGGYGIKYQGTPAADDGVDYYFWGGAFNTFFWIDRDSGHFGVFATNHSPPQYNISDDIEQIVDEARL
ncbi:beta-lactamase family protein [Gammaproteobacteria bacterium]|nr:beta-lactamase family protein [Gammaproteobacteria bacterium]